MNDSYDDRSLLEAVSFAARAHRGHERKDGRTPYVAHPYRVCLVVRHVFGFDDPRMLTAALLHDTVEDTTTDFDDVAEQFGPEVARWVALLSKDKRLPDPEREPAYIEQLCRAPWQVQVCKLADVYDNLLDTRTLPHERRSHALGRAQQYLQALGAMPAPELAAPLRRVEELHRQMRERFN
jgi:guanosine-3',5'-bis(diphosphate) 3'-pyrophosphohydrolase